MNYFFSALYCAEFRKPLFGKERFTIDVLTITVVNERGNVYSALSKQFNPSEVEDVTLNKILSSFMDKSHLTAKAASKSKTLVGKINALQELAGKTRFQIWQGLNSFMSEGGCIYGYNPPTDFTILKSIMNANQFYLRDLRQLEIQLAEDLVGNGYGVNEDSDYPFPEKELALMTSYEKAQWCKTLYSFLIKFKEKNSKNVNA